MNLKTILQLSLSIKLTDLKLNPHPLHQHHRLNRLLLQLQKLLSLFILHKIHKILLAVEFDKMHLIRLVHFSLYKSFVGWPDAEQHAAMVFGYEGNSRVFKSVENGFLSRFDID